MPPTLRAIPKVDRLLAAPELAPLLERYPRTGVVEGLREVLDGVRAELLTGGDPEMTAAALAGRVERRLAERALPYYRRVINATGVVLHTGLGRAVLPQEAVAALAGAAPSAQRLEIDLATGERGGRDEGCAALLRELTGCEAATVVNNNAGATLLVLAALARGRQVVLSRGELVEIGGSFRIPDVLEESGARLVEVGTTNRTHLEDYRRALGPDTGMLLKVHPSNYRIEGFTAEVEIEDLVALGREHGVPVVHDLGSGCMIDLARFGLPGETVLRRSVAAGADLVCCSGDKLLGGPQAGILLGRRDAVERCRRHPLFRALRPGRLIYTALEATLRLYRSGDSTALENIPVLRKLLEPEDVLKRRARRLLRGLAGLPGLDAALVPCHSQAGSGSLPARDLPSWGVRLRPAGRPIADLAADLRTGEPAILARIQDDGLLFDVRTLEDGEVAVVVGRVRDPVRHFPLSWYLPAIVPTEAQTPDSQIYSSGFFVFRTPLLPFEELEAWSADLETEGVSADRPEELERALAADRARLRERLRALAARPEILEALFLASPSLVDGLPGWLDQPDSKKGQRVERVLVRYFYRMAARATPFGLFSGCSLGMLGTESRLDLAPRSAYERHTRLDMDYLFALCEELGRDPRIREGLLYRPNSSLYRAAGRLRYAEARLVKKVRSHHLVAVEPTDYLEDTLRRAAEGARIADLAAALVSSDPDGEITLEDATDYAGELIDSQILVSDLSPLVTGPEAVHELIDLLQGFSGDAPQVAARLAEARDELAALDAGGPGAPPDRYRALAQKLEALPTPVELARLFQLDMVKPGAQPALGSAVIDEVLRGIDLLRRIAPRRQDQLETFRKDFSDRYGEGREVLLVEALDEEIGIGFERSSDVGAEASPLLLGLALAPPATDSSVTWTGREGYLFELLTEALATGAQAIEITPKDVERLSPYSGPDGGEVPHLADAFQVMLHVAAASPETLAAGDFEVFVSSAVGPSGARLLGRFCHADPELHRQVETHLRQEEAHRPDAIYAEIVHLPQGRIGNILSRPVLREHEIPFLGRSGAPHEQQIPITDLTVTVRGSRIVLRSRRLGREVVPRLTSAHNYRRGSLGIYRFLCMLQNQATQGGAMWSWGPFDNAPFLPRVTAGRLVLARATWVLSGTEIKDILKATGTARFAALRAWRERRRIPRLASLADGDNELLIDFENILSVETFLDLVEERDRARLAELYPGPDQLCARGPEGRFIHEILIPLVMRPREASPEGAERRKAERAQPPAIRRSFPPGSEWLYVKLYTGTSTADGLLRETVAPTVREALASGAADSWFFIRYADPGWHLRIRLHGDPAALHGRVLPALEESLAGFLADGRLWKVQLDTYDREVERYGGPEGIELAERLFQADSEAVLEILEMLEGDEGADFRWRLALLGCDLLFSDLGMTPEARRTALGHLRASFLKEFSGGKSLRVQLDQKLRAERRSLAPLLEGGMGEEDILAPAVDVLARRSKAIAPIAEELRQREAAGRLIVPVAEMSTSFVHMFVNRMIRSAARAHELVLYEFLHQLHESREARKRKGGRPEGEG